MISEFQTAHMFIISNFHQVPETSLSSTRVTGVHHHAWLSGCVTLKASILPAQPSPYLLFATLFDTLKKINLVK